MKRYLFAILGAAVALSGWSTGDADVIITLKSKNLQTGETKRIEVYARGNRIAYRAKDGSGMIFNGDRQTSWNFDTKHGICLKMDADSARIIKEQARQAVHKREQTLREQMAQLPTERRKRLQEQLMSLQQPPHYKRLGPDKKVGQWRCTPVAKVDQSGKQRERMCIASFKELGIDPRDQKVFESMDRFVSMMGPDHHSAHSRFTLEAEDELGLHGVAVRDEFSGIATRVLSVRHDKVPDDIFELPEGLRQISLFKP